ncbi:hypothetical protein LG3211_5018 [Lysobacter gummosus]|nr:hypothetical protein LG3211_5018 [Lysobacter gummosus]
MHSIPARPVCANFRVQPRARTKVVHQAGRARTATSAGYLCPLAGPR